ncbi:MAG TPA: class I SAM-dependent methyltransferase [Ktedonobacteraceae bacterium]
MTTESNASQLAALNVETRAAWEENAQFWDERMGREDDFRRVLIHPVSERLLDLQPGETVLEIACGNGVFARRMARSGVQIVATDFSERLLELARARSTELAEQIEYRLVDATREDQIVALGQQRFDAAVCHQGIMDIADIDPLMRGIRQVVKPGGRFVFALSHPCFNHTGIALSVEESTVDGELIMSHTIRVSQYLHASPQKGIAIIGQPTPHYYFDRPLHVLFNACFRAGLVLDGLEEPAFNYPQDGSRPTHLLSWAHYREIPPVLVARLRVPA